MPSLTFIITNPQTDSPDQQLSKTFKDQGGTIGRSSTNDWVLHDISRFISSQHAVISYQDNVFYITDLSSNGVYLDNADTPLGKGNTASLKEVHSLAIGEFILTVTLVLSHEETPLKNEADAVTSPPLFDSGFKQAQSQAPLPLEPDELFNNYGHSDPLALLDAKSSATLPNADFHLPENLFDEPSIAKSPIPAHEYSPASQIDDAFIAPTSQAESPPESHSIPENWDQTHFEQVSAVPAHAPTEQAIEQAIEQKSTDTGSPATLPPSIPGALSIPTTTSQPAFIPVPRPEFIHQPFQPPESGLEKHPLPPSFVPDSPQNFIPTLTPTEPPKPTHTEAQAAIKTQPSTEGFKLAKAAFEASGLDPALLEDHHFVDQSLALIPEMLKGLMATLKSRAEIKNELRASRTMLQSTENNPIKFSVSLQDALNNLIVQQRPGFLSPNDSVRQAFEDLTEHEAALIAGIQSGLNGVLNKLSPATIESQLEHQQGNKNLFGKLSPGKKWQHYEQTYQSVTEESNHSFIDMFGDEFLEGYETFITHHKRNGN